MKQFFIDIETNQSLDPKTGIITQLAGIIKQNGKIKKRVNFNKNIYENLVETLNTYIDPFNKTDKCYFIGYNAKFDSDFIRELFNKNNNKFYGSYFHKVPVDVLNLVAYKFMIRNISTDNFKLGTIAKKLDVPVKEDSLHDAAYDINITNEIYKKIIKL